MKTEKRRARRKDNAETQMARGQRREERKTEEVEES
jgi:hypothetical protein